MRITGTIVNYFIHCKRQCWLFAHRMNFEDDSEDVRIGRILHEVRSEGRNNTEIQIEGIKVDKMTEEYVIELPKTVKVLSVPGNVKISNDFLSYVASYKLKNNVMTVKRTFDDRTKGNVCSPQVIAAYKKISDKVLDNLKEQVLYK